MIPFIFLSFLSEGGCKSRIPRIHNHGGDNHNGKTAHEEGGSKASGISIATLDAARTNGLVSFVQYCENGSVYFTETSLQEYVARSTHRAKPREINTGTTFRNPRSVVRR